MSVAKPARICAHDLLQPAELSADRLQGLISAMDKAKIKFIDWERFGRPAFDRFVATVEVAPEHIGDVVKAAIAADRLRVRLGVLINGLPPLDRVTRLELDVTPNG